MNRVEFFEKIVIRLITTEFELFSCIKCSRDLTHVKDEKEIVTFNMVEDNRLSFNVHNATYREMHDCGDLVSSELVQCCFKGFVDLGCRGIPLVRITDYTIF